MDRGGLPQASNTRYLIMKGFRVIINDEKPVYASGKVTTIIFHVDNTSDPDTLYVGGMSPDPLYHVCWIDRRICLGDKIKVSTVEVQDISPIISKSPYYDREELLEQYRKLEDELKQKGLI